MVGRDLLSEETKCAIILFIFYTPAVVNTHKELLQPEMSSYKKNDLQYVIGHS